MRHFSLQLIPDVRRLLAVARDDWFRNTRWSSRIERDFFERLGRARSQRDQYLVVQALTLSPHNPNVALGLVDLYFESKASDSHDMRALLARADAYVALKDHPRAIAAYKAVLSYERERPSHISHTYVDLPYLIAKQKLEEEYEFALAVLREHEARLAFPLSRFRWSAAMALILSEQGHGDEAKMHAKAAVEAANIRKSGFRYHQDLGLVGESERAVVKQMHRLSQ